MDEVRACADCVYIMLAEGKGLKVSERVWFAHCGHQSAQDTVTQTNKVGQMEKKTTHRYFCSTERTRWGSCGVEGRNFVRRSGT